MTFLPVDDDVLVKFAISCSTSSQDRASVHSLPQPSLAHLQVPTQPFFVLLRFLLSLCILALSSGRFFLKSPQANNIFALK